MEKLPFTPGLEAAGVVLNDNQGFHAGERVMTTRAQGAKGGGGYASKLAVPASDLVRIPEGVTFEQAVAAGLASSTAWGGLFDLGHFKAGERVLIWAGSSGVGSMAIQLAKHAGGWVVTTTSNSAKASELRHLGADMILNRRTDNIVQAIQNAHGVNLVIELVGTTLQTSIEASAQDGRIVGSNSSVVNNALGQVLEGRCDIENVPRTVTVGRRKPPVINPKLEVVLAMQPAQRINNVELFLVIRSVVAHVVPGSVEHEEAKDRVFGRNARI